MSIKRAMRKLRNEGARRVVISLARSQVYRNRQSMSSNEIGLRNTARMGNHVKQRAMIWRDGMYLGGHIFEWEYNRRRRANKQELEAFRLAA